ncbi:MAG TPA: hypothetical protein VJ773_09975 [Gemmatimonadales bacterium]|nr:hypothetical protein [Gemmatimonadales bacterium]
MPGDPLPFPVCYVLTGGAGSIYAEMTTVSALTVLWQHPGTPVVVVTDEATGEELARTQAPLFRVARLLPLASAGADHLARSRDLKLRLRDEVPGDLLYLDADTVVVRPLQPELWECRVARLVHDRHDRRGRPVLATLPWVDDLLARAGWPRPAAYFNSGVMWLPDTPAVRDLCARWRERWRESSRLGTHKDQPALNVALHQVPEAARPLDGAYNVQVLATPGLIARARIYHFWAEGGVNLTTPATLLEHLVVELRRSGRLDTGAIDRSRRRNWPWVRSRGFRSALEAGAWGEAARSALRKLARTFGGTRAPSLFLG